MKKLTPNQLALKLETLKAMLQLRQLKRKLNNSEPHN